MIIIIISVQSIIGTSASYSRSSRLRFASTEENIKFVQQIVTKFWLKMKIFDFCDKSLLNADQQSVTYTLGKKMSIADVWNVLIFVKNFNLSQNIWQCQNRGSPYLDQREKTSWKLFFFTRVLEALSRSTRNPCLSYQV